MSELRHAVRALLRTPLVTAFAVLSLALAIGANTAAFGVLNALLLRTIAVPRPHELVAIRLDARDYADTRLPVDAFRQIAAENTILSGTLAWQGDYPMVNLEANGVRYASTLARVGGDYFATLGIRPILGRFFSAAEQGPVAVIDYRCWVNRFGRDPAVVGKTIRVDGVLRTVIGVTPESFTGLEVEVAPEVTVPLAPGEVTRVAVVARLRSGVTAETARARLDALWHSLPSADPALRLRVEPFATGFSFLRERQVPALALLLALAAAVLLIACLNLANLMLARAAARRRELGIRIALGAGRARLVRGLLAEALLLSIAGGVLGLLFAARAGRWLVALMWTGLIPTAIDPAPDLRVAAFAAALMVMAGLLVGLAPARGLFRLGPADALAGAGRASSGRSLRFDRLLVAAQFALSLVLVSGALLLARTLHEVRTADLGFRRDHLLMVRLFPRSRDPIPNRAVYYRELAGSLGRIPGVDSVSYSAMGPVAATDVTRRIGDADAVLEFTGPDFFRLLGIRLVAGREFAWSDDERSPRVAVVSQSLATRLYGGGAEAVGRPIVSEGKPATIVGVVADAGLWNPRTHNPPAVYFPVLQEPRANSFWIDLRTTGIPAVLADPVRRTLDAAGRHVALSAQTLDARLDAVLARERMTASLAVFLGAFAVLLAAVGVYGITWNAVARRTPEIGVRMALGARPSDIGALILSDLLRLVAAGIATGIPVAAWSSRWVATLAVGVPRRDPALWIAASALLGIAAVAAAWLPARRAARTDPMRAIRCD